MKSVVALQNLNPDDNNHIDKAQAVLGFSNHDQIRAWVRILLFYFYRNGSESK